MTDTRLVYHWWCDTPVKTWRDMQSPVVPAIATVRGFNRDVRVTVIDGSDHHQDWGCYPQLLDFEVVQMGASIPAEKPPGMLPFFHRLLSRTFEVRNLCREIGEKFVVYSDSDVFWKDDLLPLGVPAVDRFCGHHWNNGFYYFDRESPLTWELFDVYHEHIMRSLREPELLAEMQKIYGAKVHTDEMVYRYLVVKGVFGDLIVYMPRRENYFLLGGETEIDASARNFHFLHVLAGGDRGMFAYNVEEFYAAVQESLGDRVEDVFRDAVYPSGCVRFKNMAKLFKRPKVKKP